MTRWGQHRRDAADFRVLAALAHLDEAGGYAISRTAGIAAGRVYPSLVRLMGRGLVTDRWTTPEDGTLPQRLYRIAREADG